MGSIVYSLLWVMQDLDHQPDVGSSGLDRGFEAYLDDHGTE